MNSTSSTVLVCAISSDIGRELSLLYREQGCHVVGTYRDSAQLNLLRDQEHIDLIPCDLSDKKSVRNASNQIASLGRPWDLFIGAAGQLLPIGPFFECDIEEWCSSVMVNAVQQLRFLHSVYPHRRANSTSKVVFLVGGGINGTFTNYSAYCLAKISLVKMCELLDDEYPNVHAIAVGTGWVNTKIHKQTLHASDKAGANYGRTYEFVSSGKQGTAYLDIFNCINWGFSKAREITGGRNFSVVHDSWNIPDDRLALALAKDPGMFKLRRRGS